MAEDTNRPARKRQDLHTQIDDNLRKVYQETLEQEVPERFKQLLRQLREKTEG